MAPARIRVLLRLRSVAGRGHQGQLNSVWIEVVGGEFAGCSPLGTRFEDRSVNRSVGGTVFGEETPVAVLAERHVTGSVLGGIVSRLNHGPGGAIAAAQGEDVFVAHGNGVNAGREVLRSVVECERHVDLGGRPSGLGDHCLRQRRDGNEGGECDGADSRFHDHLLGEGVLMTGFT